MPYLAEGARAGPEGPRRRTSRSARCYLQMRAVTRTRSRLPRRASPPSRTTSSAAYNLGVALTRAGQREEGQEAMQRFQKLRDSAYKSALGSNYLEQGTLRGGAGLDRRRGRGGRPEDAGGHARRGRDRGRGWVAPPRRHRLRAASCSPTSTATARSTRRGGPRGRCACSANEPGRLVDVTAKAGLAGVAARRGRGRRLRQRRPPGPARRSRRRRSSLFHNEGGGRFEDATARPRLAACAVPRGAPPPSSTSTTTATSTSSWPARRRRDGPGLLLRNNGDGTFTDITTSRAARGGRRRASRSCPPTSTTAATSTCSSLTRRRAPRSSRTCATARFRDVAAELGLAAPGPFRCAGRGRREQGRLHGLLPRRPTGAVVARAQRRPRRASPSRPRRRRPRARSPRSSSTTTTTACSTCSSLTGRGAAAAAATSADVLGRRDARRPSPPAVERRRSRARPSRVARPRRRRRRGRARRDAARRLRRLANEGGNRNRSFARAASPAGSATGRGRREGRDPRRQPAPEARDLGRRARWPRPPTSSSASARGTAPDAVRVIWVSGIVQTETETGAAAGRADAVALAVERARPQAVVVPVPLRLERRALRVRHRLPGRRRDGLLQAPGVRNDPDPVEYVRIAPGQLVPRDGRYELRVTNELEEVLYLDRLRLARRSTTRRTSRSIPDEGMTRAAEALPALRRARPAPAAAPSTTRAATCTTAPRAARPRVRRRAARSSASAATRRSTRSRSTCRPCRPSAHAPAAHRLDRLRLLERQRRRPPGRARRARRRGSRWSGADGTWTTAIEDRSASRSAGRRRSSSTSPGKLRPVAARRASSRRMRVYWDQAAVAAPAPDVRARARGASTRRAADLARARLLGRGERPTAASRGATTTRASRRSRRGRRCPAATRARATCARCSPRRDDRSSSRSRATSWRSLRRAALPPLRRGLDAHVPAPRRRLQQGDGHQLREPRRRRCRCRTTA